MINPHRLRLALALIALTMSTGSQFTKAEELRGEHNSPNIETANQLLKESNYRDALRQFEELLKTDMDSPELLYGKARALQELGENKRSLDVYTLAIKRSPKDARLYSNRGLLVGSAGDIRRAIQDFDRAISLDKTLEQAYVNRGVAKGAMQDWKGAISDFNAAIRLNPKYAAAWRNRGIIRETIGNLKGACLDWAKAAELGQEDAHTWTEKQCN